MISFKSKGKGGLQRHWAVVLLAPDLVRVPKASSRRHDFETELICLIPKECADQAKGNDQ